MKKFTLYSVKFSPCGAPRLPSSRAAGASAHKLTDHLARICLIDKMGAKSYFWNGSPFDQVLRSGQWPEIPERSWLIEYGMGDVHRCKPQRAVCSPFWSAIYPSKRQVGFWSPRVIWARLGPLKPGRGHWSQTRLRCEERTYCICAIKFAIFLVDS